MGHVSLTWLMTPAKNGDLCSSMTQEVIVTRMHSSRMHTAHCLPYGGLPDRDQPSTETPLDREPLERDHPWTGTPLARDPHPSDKDPTGQSSPPPT